MLLQNLSLVNFKNYESAQLSFVAGVNALVGDNGQGKTNLLDAIYYLSFCKSFFNPIDSQNIRHEQDFFVLQGKYLLDNAPEEVYCGVKKNHNKVFRRNKKEYDKLADHIGLIPLVMISPYDSDLINEGSDCRRRFIDGVISQYNKKYLTSLQSYTKVLKNRNMLLKQFAEQRTWNEEMLEVYDLQLEQYGMLIYLERKDFLGKFEKLFHFYCEELTQKQEFPRIVYETQHNDGDYLALLKQSRDKDRISQYTSTGIHKDDLQFLLKDFPIKKYGSQGQQKTFLIALKLAQFQIIKEATKRTPLLLLDDIFDKIDEKRVNYLMQMINKGEFGQIFLSDTDQQRVELLLDKLTVNKQMTIIKEGVVAA